MTDNRSGMLSLIDHHCHGVVMRDLDRPAFEALLTEGTSAGPLGGTLFDSSIGLELRRHCAPVLGLDPFADPEAYLERRAELGWREASGRLISAAGLDGLYVDTGFEPEPLTTPDELSRLAGAPTSTVIRLESIAEDLAREQVAAVDFADLAAARIASAASTSVSSTSAAPASPVIAAKTIAAYRCGLALPAEEPTRPDVTAAAGAFLRQGAGVGRADRPRLSDPIIIRFLIGRAIEAGLPLQVHTGFGDADLDLRDADPLLLTPLLRVLAPTGVPVLLLHTYPFQRHAGYLAQVFDNVFCDVGLAIPHTGRRAHQVLAELLELAPFGKVLYSSDAFGLPEFYHLGAVLFRQALDRFLDVLDLPVGESNRIARLIARGNAERVYRARERPDGA